MANMNLSCLRSANSVSRIQSGPDDHGIAYEALLVAILTEISKSDDGHEAIQRIRRYLNDALPGGKFTTSLRIADDIISEAVGEAPKA